MFSKNNCLKAINKYIPDLVIYHCTFVDQGQNSLVAIVNEELIFKFPRYRHVMEELKKESEILPIISNHVTLEVPVPLYSFFESDEPGQVFVGYKMIMGTPFERELYWQLKNKQALVTQIGGFLHELHGLPTDCLAGVSIETRDGFAYWSRILTQIEKSIFPYIRPAFRKQILETFRRFLDNNENFQYKPVLTHGDFGTSNIIYDVKSGKVSGVIDFGQVALDDPAIDIASLICPMGYGEDFSQHLVRAYPQMLALLPRARFYSSTFALQEALFGLETGDQKAFEAGIAPYQ
ncbi:MAG TPA: aminoglycoside phosphotransferase family protein [Tissierellia bacterium]|nr:aminoglycoside phosphotransferase family protein [Tissierellia bacterium]